MTNFNDLSEKPSRFLSFTGYTVEEFLALLPFFALKFKEYMVIFTFEGKKRKNRKYVEYKNACLGTIENKLLFILTYIKGNELQEKIAEMFGMSQPKANIWIHLLHNVLNQALNDMEKLPARDVDYLRKKLEKLEEETESVIEVETKNIADTIVPIVKNVETIKTEVDTIESTTEVEAIETEAETLVEIDLYLHDGTERPINRPLDEELQKIYYSGKRKQHTVKNVVLIDVGCYIWFLSDTCEGKKHDKKIVDEAELSLPEGSYLGQDTGFQGFEIPGVNIVQPKKKPRGGELTEEEKEQNRTISSVRVRVEHAICGVKRYRIVKDKLRNWKKGFKDKVMETCCGLHNFRLQFRPWNYDLAVI